MTAADRARASEEQMLNLTHPANRACLIPGPDFFIIAGGIGLDDGVQAFVDR